MEEKIKPITLVIDKKLWTDFKNTVPRTIKLNDKIVDMIEKEVNKSKNKK